MSGAFDDFPGAVPPDRDDLGPLDEELLRLLRATQTPGPRPGLREDLRAAFLSGFPGRSVDNPPSAGAEERSNEFSGSRGPESPRSTGGEGSAHARLTPDDRPAEPQTPLQFQDRDPSAADQEGSREQDVPSHKSTRPAAGASGSEGPGADAHGAESRQAARALDDDDRILRELRGGALELGAPRPQFREDLRRCFLSGSFPALPNLPLESEAQQSGNAAGSSRGQADSSSSRGPQPLERVSPEGRAERRERRESDRQAEQRRARFRLLRGVVAAAAAVLLIAVLLPREPAWRIQLLEGDGLFAVNGFDDLVPIEDLENNVDLLLQSSLVQTRSNRVQLTLPDELVVELTPKSSIDVRGLVPRPRDGVWRMRVDQGEAYIHKAKETHDRVLHVETLDSVVQVLGTTLGVECTTDYTCVCVAEGDVDVDPNPSLVAPKSSVEGGRMLVVKRRPGSSEDALHPMEFPSLVCPSTDVHDHHVCGLQGFYARMTSAP